uniref:Uncharacterized protein n=1 Tax=Roseihalotalea indica TaxID=2867963 RepID=A0AA49GPX9_9BACT|nr:hypothetical protein K4G66_06545 [Tunicatimonas sp. TK19036]
MQKTDYLQDISEIRSMMERSSRFISLSGLSGVMAGVYALVGAGVAQWCLSQYRTGYLGSYRDAVGYLALIASVVLLLAIGTGIWLTTRRARRQGLKVWDATVRRLVIHLLIPLVAGGIFCLVLVGQGYTGIVAPSMLMFYGLALINASKYTLTDVMYLGLAELGLGLLSAIVIGYGLLFWTIGFGVLHIVYGASMYYKYER